MKRGVLALTAAMTAMFSVVPLAASAQRHGGGGSSGGAMRSAPARAAAPQSRPAAPTGGFDLHEDVAPASTAKAQRPIASQPASHSAPAATRPIAQSGKAAQAHGAAQGHRPALVANLGYGGQRGNHRVIPDARYGGGAWGWNHGAVWNPAQNYWGGGFWGPYGLGGAFALFGTIAYDDATLDSYQVEPDSPGAELLDNYGLTQVPCGPPDLVVIFGPDNSVICADPNDTVAAGEYQLDPSDLTIVSLDS